MWEENMQKLIADVLVLIGEYFKPKPNSEISDFIIDLKKILGGYDEKE